MRPLKNSETFKALLREDKEITLILLDIDNFSNINEFFGLDNANELLIHIENMLNKFRFKDIDVYNFEADEFGLVCQGLCSVESSIEIANEINAFFNETTIEVDEDFSANISLSIGIASGKGLVVFNHARLAIRELREHTRGTYKVYDGNSAFIKAIQDDVYYVNKIQESIAAGDITAFYQPIINNKNKKIEKYECLARIEDEGNFVSPYHFMSAAKKTRMISFITKSMIKQSCKMFSKTDYEFSINITNADLQLGFLEQYLLRNAALYNIDPSRIVLELLEDIPSLDAGTILEQIASLKERGFQVAIDDFGTESSNFSRLLEFQPDYLKIDGIFIRNILTDKRSQIITEGIVAIAHKMGIKMIAEYIHNEEVQAKAEELGIDYSQGFLHGKPSRKPQF